MTLMVLLSCLVALIFLAVVAWALIQINDATSCNWRYTGEFFGQTPIGLKSHRKTNLPLTTNAGADQFSFS